MYRTHAASLIQTGGGVDPDKAEAGDNAHHEYSDCYIPASGPDASTTERAKNIWRKFKSFLVVTLRSDLQCIEQIIIDFPYFPELHRLLSTRPNFNPPALTTGVGPQGRKTVHYQAPAQVQRAVSPAIDPYLIGLTFPPRPRPPLGPSATSNTMATEPTTVPSSEPVAQEKENPRAAFVTPARGPKSSAFGSTQLDDAVCKARASGSVKPLSAKRGSSIEDAFTKMSRCVYLSRSIDLFDYP